MKELPINMVSPENNFPFSALPQLATEYVFNPN